MELIELTLHELQERLGRREISALEIVDSIFERINSVEDQVQAFVTLTEESARHKAAAHPASVIRTDRQAALQQAGTPQHVFSHRRRPAGDADTRCRPTIQ